MNYLLVIEVNQMTYKNIVKVDQAELNVYIEGEKAPVLVFMAGLEITAPVLEYRPLYSKLKETHKIAVIERSGYGFSGTMKRKRTLENLVLEDRYALKEAGLEPPYVLVPHDYAGFEAIYWANKYPDEVMAVLGNDMTFPDHTLTFSKEVPDSKMQSLVNKRREYLTKVAGNGIFAKLQAKKTIDASGLMSGDLLNDEEKRAYKILYYDNILNEEIYEASMLMRENATKAHDTGVLKCPCCFFISDMKTDAKTKTWQEAGVEYAKRCGAEYHLTNAGHYPYTIIPDRMCDIFNDFLRKTFL